MILWWWMRGKFDALGMAEEKNLGLGCMLFTQCL